MKYVIWSEEHGAWWGPNASGYTRELTKDGRYEKTVAEKIVAEANQYLGAPTFAEVILPDPLL